MPHTSCYIRHTTRYVKITTTNDLRKVRFADFWRAPKFTVGFSSGSLTSSFIFGRSIIHIFHLGFTLISWTGENVWNRSNHGIKKVQSNCTQALKWNYSDMQDENIVHLYNWQWKGRNDGVMMLRLHLPIAVYQNKKSFVTVKPITYTST